MKINLSYYELDVIRHSLCLSSSEIQKEGLKFSVTPKIYDNMREEIQSIVEKITKIQKEYLDKNFIVV